MSIGMILLAIWLILNGLPGFVRFVIRAAGGNPDIAQEIARYRLDGP